MPAIVKILQVDSPNKRKSILQAIHAETESLRNSYEVSIFDAGDGNLWELVISPPKGVEVYKALNARDGDLEPAAFRAKLRGLMRML